MTSKRGPVLNQLPDNRRVVLEAVRATILNNLPLGYIESINYGVIGYYVAHSIYPAGYHRNPDLPLPFASLASQKNHMALHCMGICCDEKEQALFRKQWQATAKKLDLGKSCIRFRKLDDVPLSVIGQMVKRITVKKYIAI